MAQMLAGQLWLLPQTNTEQLMSSVICITFGQPLIRSDLLMNVAEIYPDFRNNVHAICLSSDNFPLLIEMLDPLVSANKVHGVSIIVDKDHQAANNNNSVVWVMIVTSCHVCTTMDRMYL